MTLQKVLLILTFSLTGAGCCNEEKIPAYNNDLYSDASQIRNEAALQLARCGERAEIAVPKLAQMLYDSNVGVQSSAAYALRKIDSQSARQALASAIAAREARR